MCNDVYICHDMSALLGPCLTECASLMDSTIYGKSKYVIQKESITDLKFQTMLPFSPTKFPYAHVCLHQHHRRRHHRIVMVLIMFSYLIIYESPPLKLRTPRSNPREQKLGHQARNMSGFRSPFYVCRRRRKKVECS